MKTTLLVFLAALMLAMTGCGRPVQDPAFAQYVDQWKADYKMAGLGDAHPEALEIVFKINLAIDTTIGAHGLCVNNSLIEIDPVSWQQLDNNGKKLMIYHELGHCMMGKSHSPDPTDIMYHDPGTCERTFENNPESVLNRYFH